MKTGVKYKILLSLILVLSIVFVAYFLFFLHQNYTQGDYNGIITNNVAEAKEPVNENNRFDIDVQGDTNFVIKNKNISTITDKNTGVMYMVITFDKGGVWRDAAAGVSVTPLYNPDGSLVIDPEYNIN